MQAHGLRWSDTLEKPEMIKLILRGGPYTPGNGGGSSTTAGSTLTVPPSC